MESFFPVVLGKRLGTSEVIEEFINITNKILLITPLYLESKFMLDKNDFYLY